MMMATPVKRPASADGDDDDVAPQSKKSRIEPAQPILSLQNAAAASSLSPNPSPDEIAKAGLKRAIALVLNRIGFDAACPEAFESFATMAETYVTHFMEDMTQLATAARRSTPTVIDFEKTLARFNISRLSDLQVHTKPPIPRRSRRPRWFDVAVEDPTHAVLPLLGPDLDGRPEKASKLYIPSCFPDFPSIHTYRNTPEEVSHATANLESLGGAKNDSPSAIARRGRPLAVHETPRGDPKRMREAAAREAKLGEEALRRLMRASKIAKQKEVRTVAQRNPARKERHELWEDAMRELIEEDGRDRDKNPAEAGDGDAGTAGGHATTSAMARFEIADHSMIVDAEKRFHRKTVNRRDNLRDMPIEL